MTRLALVAATVVVAAVGGLYLLREDGGPSVGATPSPPPSATASARPSPSRAPAPTPLGSLPTAEYTSDRYGYTILFPSELQPKPATLDWSPGTVASTTSSDLDKFIGQATSQSLPGSFLGIASQALPQGVTAETWMTEHAARNQRQFGDTCGGRPEDWQPTTVAGNPGRRAALTCEGGAVTEVVFVAQGRGWVVSGDTVLVDFVLPTLQLPG